MDEYSILNTNDCPYELASETIIENKLHNKKIDLLLVGYASWTYLSVLNLIMKRRN